MPDTLQSPAYRRLIDRLREARIEAGLTQQALADSLGRPQSLVAKIEGYERRLDILELLEIADFIGVDPIKLIREELRDS